MGCWDGGARQAPFGPAGLEKAGRTSGIAKPADRLVRVGAEGTAAVGDDLPVRRKLGQSTLQLLERDRAGALDVPGRELLLGPNVDEDDVAPRQSLEQLLAADRLDLVAEVLARGALDLPEVDHRGVTQGEPEPQRIVAGERVDDAGAFAGAEEHPSRVQRLQMLGGVGGGLAAGTRQLLDTARRLRQQVEQLEPAGAGKRLPHQRDRLE